MLLLLPLPKTVETPGIVAAAGLAFALPVVVGDAANVVICVSLESAAAETVLLMFACTVGDMMRFAVAGSVMMSPLWLEFGFPRACRSVGLLLLLVLVGE